MKKAECIERYGEEEWERRLEQGREYNKVHREEAKAYTKKYREEHLEETKAAVKKYHEEHPEEIKAHNQKAHQEQCRKGGKYYDRYLAYEHIGLRGDRNAIRKKHAHQYKPYKQIIAPDSQIHHEWMPKTAEYRGLALVEKEPHQYGIVDVIEILEGKITLLTEEEVGRGKENEKESI
jgi:hypothetical protein